MAMMVIKNIVINNIIQLCSLKGGIFKLMINRRESYNLQNG